MGDQCSQLLTDPNLGSRHEHIDPTPHLHLSEERNSELLTKLIHDNYCVGEERLATSAVVKIRSKIS